MVNEVHLDSTDHGAWKFMVWIVEEEKLKTKIFANKDMAYAYAKRHAKRLGVTIKPGHTTGLMTRKKDE